MRDGRTVWSDERGGQIGGSPSKQKRQQKKQKQNKQAPRKDFPKDGVVRVQREKGGRGGKTVTVVAGVPGGAAAQEALLKDLKKVCGCGGALKGGLLEIQGDQRDRILEHLLKEGFQAKAAGG